MKPVDNPLAAQVNHIHELENLALILDQWCKNGKATPDEIEKAERRRLKITDELTKDGDLGSRNYIIYEVQALTCWLNGQKDTAATLAKNASSLKGDKELFTQTGKLLLAKSLTTSDVANTQNGLAVAGMVLGIVGVTTAWLGLGALVGIIGVCLSGVALRHAGKRGMAIAGLVTSICAIVFGSIMLIAIGINAYSNIQERATNLSTNSQTSSVVTKAEAYNADNGTYPSLDQLTHGIGPHVLDGSVVENVGAYGSLKDIEYIRCESNGALIWSWNTNTNTYDAQTVGDTSDCQIK